jgi:hypothetical protein
MKKLVAALAILVVIICTGDGFLFYQIQDTQNLNNRLKSENVETQNQIGELQISNSELENQLAELQNQSSEQETKGKKYLNLIKMSEFTIEPTESDSNVYHTSGIVKIENFGINDVEGLTLIIYSPSVKRLVTHRLDVLYYGETREIPVEVSYKNSASTVKAILKLGYKIIGERIGYDPSEI